MKKSHPKKSTLTTKAKRAKSRELAIRERDRKILELVYSHRFLSTELLWYLLMPEDNPADKGAIGRNGKRRPKRYAFGRQALYKRLLQLHKARYLNRYYIYDEQSGQGHGVRQAIYGLGSKSSKILSDMIGIDPKEVRYIVEANKVKSAFRQHAVEISRFRVILELACRGSNGKVKLLFWEQGTMLRDYVHGIDHRGEEKRFSVDPDAFFGLEVEGKGRAHYFLELDRGTMPIVSESNRSDIRKKIFAYYYYRKSKKYMRKYHYSILPNGDVTGLQIADESGFRGNRESDEFPHVRGFTVLFLTPGKIDSDRSISGRIANILSVFQNLGKVSAARSLFWFSVPDVFNLENPESAFETVWVTANPQNPYHSLID